MASMSTKLTATWQGLIQGKGHMASETIDLPIAMPQSFGGRGGGSHPKELLMASAAACYVMTLAGMLEARNLPLDGVAVSSELSELHKQGMKITHEIRINLLGKATQEQLGAAEALIEAADKACMVGNLLKTAGVQLTASGTVTNVQGA